MKKDYFAILGLEPSASDKEIRAAYKRLARKYHPDLNPGDGKAEETFKEVSEAYAVLTDPEKRRKWESGDFDFDAFFGGSGAGMGGFGAVFEDLFGGAGSRGRARGADLRYEASISFEDAAQGTSMRIPLAHTIACSTCGGDGFVRSGAAAPCVRCGGSGTRRSTETIQVRIPPGVDNGSKVRVAGKGEAGRRGGPPGDLYVILQVSPHRFFRRDGSDVVLDLPLTVTEAALGTRLEVPTINGRVALTVPPGSRSGQRLRLRGRGVAARGGRGAAGDQIVVLQIVTPRTIDERSRRVLEEFQRLNPEDPRADLGW